MGKLMFVLVGFIVLGVLVVGIHDAYGRGKVEKSQTQLEQMLNEQSFNSLVKNQVALDSLLQTMEHNRPWLIRPQTTFAQNQGCTKIVAAYTQALDQNLDALANTLFNLSTELRCD